MDRRKSRQRGGIAVARMILGASVLLAGAVVFADVPGAIDVTCDVDRKEFRRDAQSQSQVCFRLWTSEVGGAQVGDDYCVAMSTLMAVRIKTESFDSQGARSFVRLSTTIGSDLAPVPAPPAGEAWLDVAVGPQTLGCNLSAGTPTRRRIPSSLFARSAPGDAGPELLPGTIVAYGGPVAPPGWLLCDGAATSRADYPDLFAAIVTSYGVGDGLTTFNVPDLRGRGAVGAGSNADVDALGDNDGMSLASRTPKHSHIVNPHSHSVSNHQHWVNIFTGPEGTIGYDPSRRYPKNDYDNYSHGHGVVGPTDPGGAGNTSTTTNLGTNVQTPGYLTTTYIIKY